MNKNLGKSLKIVMVLVLIVVYLCSFIVVNATEPILISAQSYENFKMQSVVDFYEKSDIDYNDWELICALYGAGVNFDKGIYETLNWDTNTISKDAAASLYGSRMLALIALNQDPRNIWGRNLVTELESMQNEDGSFGTITDNIYAGLALEAVEGTYNSESFVTWLISMQNEDGGIGFSKGISDLDTSGIALVLLSKFKDNENAKNAIENIKTYVKSQQLPSAGFASWGSENSNSIARVITGLVAVGEDITSDVWKMNDNNMLDVLYEFELEDGSYTWINDKRESNLFSTKQVLLALADVVNGKSTFDLIDDNNEHINFSIKVEGINNNILNKNILYSYSGIRNVTVKEGLEYALNMNAVPYTISDTSYGPYLTSINNEDSGKFGGYDGWLYLMNGSSGMGIGYDVISEYDDLLFYYGEMAPLTVVPQITLSNDTPKFGSEFTVKVTTTYNEYDASYMATLVTKNVEGTIVSVNNQKAITDENGECILICDTIKENKVIAYKKNDEGLPTVVRTESMINSTFDETILYANDSAISVWARDAVYYARLQGLMDGNLNRFSAKGLVKRGELVRMIMDQKGLSISPSAMTAFDDVTVENPYYAHIATAEELGIIAGKTDSKFAPYGLIKREEMAVIIAKAYNLNPADYTTYQLPFTDANTISIWALDAVKSVNANKVLNSYNNMFNSKDYVTYEMCAVILNLIENNLK